MEVSSVVGYHDVNNVKARELLQPHLGTNGYYLLRPSSDRKGGVLCTICVTNNNKLMNYRLVHDPATGKYYIFQHTMFPNIQLLLAYYKTTPINADVKTFLLYPVTPPDPRQQQREEDGEDAYVIMERPPATTKEDDTQIPGLHEYLPKSEIGTVINNYLGADGWYLLRPSSTSEGQLTLAVSHGGRILNFKINGESNQFYIAPKKRFNSVRALLDYYKTSPIRSRKYGSSKILLLNPIPVDRKQEDMFKQKLEQKVAKKLSKANLLPEPLPEPWQEHYDERYKRCYYYNPQTGQSSWERPKAPPTTTPSSLTTPTTPSSQKGSKSPRLPSRTESMLGRPLPATPGSVSTGDDMSKSRRMSDVSGSMSPRTRKAQQPLPAIPGEKEETSNAHPMKSHRRNTENKRNVVRHVPDIKETPALPSKDVPVVPGRAGSRGSLPALPPKEDSPSHAGRSPSMNRRAQMPLPEEPGNKFQRKAIPSLPPKEPEKASPRLPQKQSNGSIPPLPPKEMSPPVAQEAEKPLPPLPPKSKSPSPPPKVEPPPSSNRKPRKKIVEYEDFPIRQPKAKANVPPLPEKEDKGAAAAPPPPPLPVANGAPPPPTPPTINGSGGAPPPPPPPPVGMPVPPPPPPNAPPSPNPAAAGSRRAAAAEKRSQSTSSEEGGRPFTANDLAQAKTLLKKRKESPEEDRRSSAPNSGIAGVFANAIDSRITSIRKAMVDSDSEESEFEDIDDDDWDD